MSHSLSRPVVLIFLLALALPTLVSAQDKETADLHGVVLDASGKPAAGYPMKLTTSQWGEVILHPTETDGTFAVTGLPPGSFEVRVFEPSGSTDHPIATKKVTLTAGQAEKLEIRLGSGDPGVAPAPKPAAGRRALGTTLGAAGANWTALVIFALVLALGFAAFFAMRVREKARS